jgi:hypothetical protein
MGSVSPSLTLAISRFGIDPQRGFKRSSVANASLCTYGLVTSSVRSTFLSCVPGTPRVRGVNEISKQFLATYIKLRAPHLPALDSKRRDSC